MRTRLWTTCLAALGAALLTSPWSASAQDRERDRERLREQLHQDVGLSAPEWASMAPEVDGFLRGGGQGAEVRQMVREAHAAGCRGECLAEAVRSMNRARSHGLSGAQAREMVSTQVQAQVRERHEQGQALNEPEMARQLRERVENTLTHRERETERHGDDRSGRESGSGSGSSGGGSPGGGGDGGHGGGHGGGGGRR